jgi:hypothetical protein
MRNDLPWEAKPWKGKYTTILMTLFRFFGLVWMTD